MNICYLNNLGMVKMKIKNLGMDSIDHFVKCIYVKEDKYGKDSMELANSYHNLAHAKFVENPTIDHAIKFYTKEIELRLKQKDKKNDIINI